MLLGNHFESQSPPELHFGLGSAEMVDALEIRWADGGVTRRENLSGDQILDINQGEDIGELIDPSRNGAGGGAVPDPDLVEDPGAGGGDGDGDDDSGDDSDRNPYGLDNGSGAGYQPYAVPLSGWMEPVLFLLLLLVAAGHAPQRRKYG